MYTGFIKFEKSIFQLLLPDNDSQPLKYLGWMRVVSYSGRN